MLFISSVGGVELGLARVKVRFIVWLVSGYAHVSVLLAMSFSHCR